MAVVTPLNNFLGPEGDTVTMDEQLLNTEYWRDPSGGRGTAPIGGDGDKRGLMILKPRGASTQVATHSHLPRVWREAGMEGRSRS